MMSGWMNEGGCCCVDLRTRYWSCPRVANHFFRLSAKPRLCASFSVQERYEAISLVVTNQWLFCSSDWMSFFCVSDNPPFIGV